jgi:glycosyltransferase involved in cell wall biosynthesis
MTRAERAANQREQIAVQIDVILCTCNPRRDYLERTLAALDEQVFAGERPSVAVSLVDNNSSPEVVAWLRRMCEERGIQYLHEAEQGLVHARICGLRNTKAGLIVWVDDDTVLEPNYLAEASKVYCGKPFLGAWGGSIRLELEKPVPEYIRPHLALLTENSVEVEEWSSYRTCTPVAGAGMCVRREVGDRYVENYESSPMRKLLGRSSERLFSGEDWDFCLTAVELGLGVGRMPQLALTHLIPERRTTEDYLLKIAEGHKYSGQIVLAIRGMPPIRESFDRKILGLHLRGLLKPSFRKRILIAELKGLKQGLDFVQRNFRS